MKCIGLNQGPEAGGGQVEAAGEEPERDYKREPRVEKQLAKLASMSAAQRKVVLGLKDPSLAGESLYEETLVVSARELVRAEKLDEAWNIVEALSRRAAAKIASTIRLWRLRGDDADEFASEALTSMYDSVLSVRPADQFWEIRFWICLDRKLITMMKKRRRQLDAQSGLSATDEANEPQLWAHETAASAISWGGDPVKKVVIDEALAILPDKQRTAFLLHYFAGMPEESTDPGVASVARSMNVTGRSVRNYLKRAEELLKSWRDADGQK